MNIAIVGAHRATKLDAPYDDPDWRIWSLSKKNESELPRHDVWFEIHNLPSIEANPVYADWLKQQPFVYMQGDSLEYPKARKYPIKEMLSEFGPYFFTGTISYMLALAINKRPKTIGMWGISGCAEYSKQRPSILHFVQCAKDRGIEVVSPSYPLLEPNKLYAFDIERLNA